MHQNTSRTAGFLSEFRQYVINHRETQTGQTKQNTTFELSQQYFPNSDLNNHLSTIKSPQSQLTECHTIGRNFE